MLSHVEMLSPIGDAGNLGVCFPNWLQSEPFGFARTIDPKSGSESWLKSKIEPSLSAGTYSTRQGLDSYGYNTWRSSRTGIGASWPKDSKAATIDRIAEPTIASIGT